MSYLVTFRPVPGITPKGVVKPVGLQLPGLVNDLTTTESASHQDYETVAIGAFSQPVGGRFARQLQDQPLEFMWAYTPAEGNESLSMPGAGFVSPESYYDQLSVILRRRAPVEMIIADRLSGQIVVEMSSSTGGGCTLRDLERTRRAGNPGILGCTVTVKEWRNPSDEPTTSTVAFTGIQLPAGVTSKPGDTWESLAFLYYGSYSYWKDLASANGLTPGANVYGSTQLAPGTRVKVPERPPVAGASSKKTK